MLHVTRSGGIIWSKGSSVDAPQKRVKLHNTVRKNNSKGKLWGLGCALSFQSSSAIMVWTAFVRASSGKGRGHHIIEASCNNMTAPFRNKSQVHLSALIHKFVASKRWYLNLLWPLICAEFALQIKCIDFIQLTTTANVDPMQFWIIGNFSFKNVPSHP